MVVVVVDVVVAVSLVMRCSCCPSAAVTYSGGRVPAVMTEAAEALPEFVQFTV